MNAVGRIAEFDAMDQLGWIDLDDGTRVRFGLPSLEGAIGAPQIGLRVRVRGAAPGFRGVLKATRVVPEDFVERVRPTPAELLAALGLPTALAADDWPKTCDGLVTRFAVGGADPAIDAHRMFSATPESAPARAVLARWLGEAIPSDVAEPMSFAADVWLIRSEHGPTGGAATDPALFELPARTGSLFLLRDDATRERVHEDVELLTLHDPDVSAALSGIFRAGNVPAAFEAHAPRCDACQSHLREVVARFGAHSLPPAYARLAR